MDMTTFGMTAEHAAGIYGRERNRAFGGASDVKQNVGRAGEKENIDGQAGVSFRECIEDALQKGTVVFTGNNMICIIPEEALSMRQFSVGNASVSDLLAQGLLSSGMLYAGLSGYGLSGGLSSAGLLSSGMGFMSPGLLSSGLSAAGLASLGLAKQYGINVSSGIRAATGYSGRSTNRAGMINAYKNTLKSAKGRLSERR